MVLASSLSGDGRGPLWLVAGLSASFAALALALARLGPALGIRPETVATAAALAMVGFGLIRLVPAMGARFGSAAAGISARADAGNGPLNRAGRR